MKPIPYINELPSLKATDGERQSTVDSDMENDLPTVPGESRESASCAPYVRGIF